MSTNIRNLTPHAINVVDHGGETVAVFPATGQVARLGVDLSALENAEDGTPIGALRYGNTTGLPAAAPGTLLLVSLLVKLANPDREDLLVVADEVRDDQGRIVGCRALARHVTMGDG